MRRRERETDTEGELCPARIPRVGDRIGERHHGELKRRPTAELPVKDTDDPGEESRTIAECARVVHDLSAQRSRSTL